jgi:hypothetical protein
VKVQRLETMSVLEARLMARRAEARRALAADPATPTWILDTVQSVAWLEGDTATLAAVASNPSTHLSVLRRLHALPLQYEGRWIAAWVQENPALGLAQLEDPRVGQDWEWPCSAVCIGEF